ncbi:hypothetical protein GCM10008018_52550 [Paenibacillus marchantiophytorum]|uniref:Small, acid-soluble spore protein, alpha/beta type n=1 Tax=Paenibacillus marchantiophytorum TaxID=1619310 RepID=A0ABQ1F4J2_9BACL|nr:hypothetical protein GCM10008018_52550 [Paenibacillus marchantiophytorum]
MGRRRGVMSENFKYELAKDLGFYDVVQREGWEGIRTKDAGNMVKRAIQIAQEHLAKQHSASSPSVSSSSYNQQAYSQPTYNQATYSHSGYSQVTYNQPTYNQPMYNQSNSNQPMNQQQAGFMPSTYVNQPYSVAFNPQNTGSGQASPYEQRPN